MVRFMYVRDEKKCPVGCLAYRIEKDSTTGEVNVTYGLSTHNPVDTFDRSRARLIAEGRLNQHGAVFHYQGDDSKSNEVVSEVLRALRNDKTIPMRFRKAALNWLNADKTPKKMN